MDPYVQKLWRYRELLHGELPIAARLTIQWLLVDAVREHTHLKPQASPWEAIERPQLVSVANDVLEQAVTLMGAQFGVLQLYVSAQDTLLMIAARNFAPDFADRFACFTPDGRTACSRALASQRRVIVEDVANDELFAPHADAALSAGFRSLQATPVTQQSGEVVGIITTHYAAPRAIQQDRLGRLDEYVRGASSEIVAACA